MFGDDFNVGKVVAGLSNADLTWEVSKEYNFGLDFAILKNRLNFGIEVYNKKTEGSILTRQLSYVTGFEAGVP